MAKDCCAPHGKIMDYIKSNKFAIGIACMAIILLVMLVRESSWSAETSLKINADTDVSRKKVKDNQTSDNKDHKVIIFYFYGNVRCFTCKRIESGIRRSDRPAGGGAGIDQSGKCGSLV